MLVSSRYSGLELPVHQAEDVQLTDPLAMRDAAPGDTFTEHTALRTMQIELSKGAPLPESLKKLLAITDTELKAAAKFCGATVIGHNWGLVYDPEGVHYSNIGQYELCGRASGLVPKDHFLVAEIDILRDATDMRLLNTRKILGQHATRAAKVGIGTKLYHIASHTEGYRLWDIIPKQFVIGRHEENDGEEISTWLVDIEPRLTSS